jgi:cell division protein FtsB
MRAVIFLAILFSIAICLHTLIDGGGMRHRHKLKNELQALRDTNDHLATRVATLRAQAEALSSRADVQEHVVRDELGYVRGNDIVIDFGATSMGR